MEYLHLFGYTAYAYLMAAAARQREVDPAFHDGKLATARFYFARILPACTPSPPPSKPAAKACTAWRRNSSEASVARPVGRVFSGTACNALSADSPR